MSNEEIYEAYMERFSYMPISPDKVELFFKEYPTLRSCEDPKLLNILFDWVGSRQLYEEGAEEMW